MGDNIPGRGELKHVILAGGLFVTARCPMLISIFIVT